MSSFQQFCLWARRAPIGERVAAGMASILVLGVLAWLVVPGSGSPAGSLVGSGPSGGAGAGLSSSSTPTVPPISNSSRVGSGAPGGSGGAAGAGPAGASGPVSTNRSGTAVVTNGTGPGPGTPNRSSSLEASGCVPAASGAPGVSSEGLKVSVTLANIVGPAGNNSFGLPSAAEQQSDYQDVIGALNASGGVACRKLVPEFFTVNPADSTDLQQKCLDIVQAGVFAELDASSYAGFAQKNCYPQNHIPYFTSYFLPASEMDQFYPYMFAFDSLDSLYHNTVFGLKARGFFQPSNGFRKLGFLYRDCSVDLVHETMAWLQQTGVPASSVVAYNDGCPNALASPSDLEQAVLKFQQAGVTNVSALSSEGDLPGFTTIAEQQNFHPKYGLADEAQIEVTYGTEHPDYNNIAGALIVTASRYGEERTPGMSPTPATVRCNAIYQAHGQKPVYQQLAGFGGQICNEVWMFAAAVDHSPIISPTTLSAGLEAARSVDFSYPEGPNDLTGGRTTVAGQYWRTAQFRTACNCWQVIDPTFHPSYP